MFNAERFARNIQLRKILRMQFSCSRRIFSYRFTLFGASPAELVTTPTLERSRWHFATNFVKKTKAGYLVPRFGTEDVAIEWKLWWYTRLVGLMFSGEFVVSMLSARIRRNVERTSYACSGWCFPFSFFLTVFLSRILRCLIFMCFKV